MNTDQMNELFFLHSMTNNPVDYESNDKKRDDAQLVKNGMNFLAQLYQTASRFFTSAKRNDRFRAA